MRAGREHTEAAPIHRLAGLVRKAQGFEILICPPFAAVHRASSDRRVG